jgi:integrase
MPKTLTDIRIRNLKPGPTPREVAVGGARGLYLWIGASGARSFVVRYRINGRPQKLTLGRWVPPEDRREAKTDPQLGDPLSLAAARKLAADTLLQLGRGRDPAAVKRDDRQAREQAQADTFEAITDEYFRRVAGMRGDAESFDRSKLRSAAHRYAALRKHVFPVIGNKPVSEIRRGDINRLLDRVEDEAGIVMADRVLSFIRIVFNWHAIRDEKFNSPIVKGMARTKPNERARQRILNDDELRAIWKVAGEDKGPFGPLLRFLLLTGARRNEAAAMTWAEVQNGNWTLPAVRNKTKVDFVRPLSKKAQAILDDRPRVEGNPFVFSLGRASFSGFSKAKKDFDKACGVTDWTLHDLRRTARSLLSRRECNVTSDLAEIALGHKLPGVRGVYDRHQYQEEKQQAFEALAALIDRIINPPSANVVAFQKAGE